ncbi:MAG: DNA starvation/stationary phase protection protein [Bacteroidales bacterium]|jgi:starvation-inducible DNA-binding protein|nr:DNA starvation/stationary phase protection protein [Bacteroidales bacterium]
MKTLDYIKIEKSNANEINSHLEQLLADLQIFYTNLRGFHWNIKGKGFFQLHSKFEELYNDINEKADEIAERILILGGRPTNKFSDYIKISRIKEVSDIDNGEKAIENILETLSVIMKREREIIEIASKYEDESTVAIMSDYLKEQEKLVWMLVAHQS